MPPISPITKPLIKKAWRIMREVNVGFLALEWAFEEEETVDSPDVLEWRRFVFNYSRSTPAGTVEDLACFGIDVVNITDGVIDPTWTPGDHATVNAIMTNYAIAIKPLMANTSSLVNIKAYRRQFAEPMTVDKRFMDSGPPANTDISAIVGTGTGNPLPYQCAMSVTLKTPAPRHWGRHYIPNLTEDISTTNGRFDAADVTTAANAAGVMVNALYDAQFPAVVPSTQTNGVLMGALLSVTGVQVDDIPDVIRRRRPKQAAIRTQVLVT